MTKEVNKLDLDMLIYNLINYIDYIYYEKLDKYEESSIVIKSTSYVGKYHTLSIGLKSKDKYYEYMYLEMLSKETIIEIFLSILDRLKTEFKETSYERKRRINSNIIDNINVKFVKQNKELVEINFINQSYSDTLSVIDEVFSNSDKESIYKRVLKK